MNKLAALLLSGLIASTAAANATPITGTVYTNTPDPNNASDPANYASTLASATFTVGTTGIDFENQNNVSVATFLNNPTFSNLTNGFSSSTLVNSTGGQGTEVVISGMLSLLSGMNTYVVGHDDGAVLTVAGNTILNSPGPTVLNTDTMHINNPGAAGNYAFTLTYAECCSAPEDLIFKVNGSTVGASPVPEPSSLALLGSGLLGACGAIRRRILARA